MQETSELRAGSGCNPAIEAPPGYGPDWLSRVWTDLPDRTRDVLVRRLRGETLESIGRLHHVGRERIRQIQKTGVSELVAAQVANDPGLDSRARDALDGRSAVTEEALVRAIHLARSDARDLVLDQLGLRHPKVGTSTLTGLWCLDDYSLEEQLDLLLAVVPCSEEEATAAAAELGMPPGFDWHGYLTLETGSLMSHPLGLVRRSRAVRDIAYLWLRAEGEPRPLAELVDPSGAVSIAALRELLRRDPEFVRVKPEGTWALADWRLPGTGRRYESALDAVVEVLRELGPMRQPALQAEVQLRYPVSAWRVQQCLSSTMVGLNESGEFDLAERGARPVEDAEPTKPAHIEESGSVLGISMQVTHDMLRGSGLGVHRWLTWRLGLRTAPSSRYFRLPSESGEVVVRRGLSGSQVSSLRVAAQSLGVVEGCTVVMILRTADESAELVHSCPANSCPAMDPTPPGHDSGSGPID